MVSTIIVAAGKGTRLKGEVRKQYLTIAGRPILSHTLGAFSACSCIDEILLVAPEKDFDFIRDRILSCVDFNKPFRLVQGGLERQDSVYQGLRALRHTGGIVVIHDGVRPLVQPEQITDCVHGAVRFGSCIMGIPVHDTLKRVDESGFIRETVERASLWLVQTPQAFQYDLIKNAHERARKDGRKGTDDAFLVEQTGQHVKMIKGSPLNIKITTQDDLILAESIIKSNSLIY